MENGDLRREVRAKPVHERHGQGDLRHENQGGPALGDDLGDCLGVHRGLAGAGNPLQEERRRIALRGRFNDECQRRGLRFGERGALWPGPAPAGTPSLQRPARTFAKLGGDEAAADKVRGGPGAVALSRFRSGEARLAGTGEIGQECPLPNSKPAGGAPGPGTDRRHGRRHGRGPHGLARRHGLARCHVHARRHRRHRASLVRQSEPAFVAWAGARRGQGPLEPEQTPRRHRPQAPQGRGAAVVAFEVRDRQRPRREPLADRHLGSADWLGSKPALFAFGQPLGNQVQPLEHPGWQHRSEHGSRRREVLGRDPAREFQRQARQQWTIGPDAGEDRFRGERGVGRRDRTQDDAKGLPGSAEFDQHGLAVLYTGQSLGYRIGVGPRRPRSVNGNFDECRGSGSAVVADQVPRHAPGDVSGDIRIGRGKRTSVRAGRRLQIELQFLGIARQLAPPIAHGVRP